MSFRDSISNFFTPAGGATIDASPGQAAQGPAAPAPSANSNTTVPSDSTIKSDGKLAAIPAAGEGDASPLAGFKDLWKTPDPKDVKAAPSLVPDYKVDPKALAAAAANIDFTKTISPETLAAAAKGNDAAALAKLVSEVAQAAVVHSAGTTVNIVQDALTRQEKVFRESVMPAILKQHNTRNEIRDGNPLLDNPAVAPMFSAIEAQLLAKNPNSSPTEIKAMATDYFENFATEILKNSGKVISDAPANDGKSSSRKATDWSSYFDTPAR